MKPSKEAVERAAKALWAEATAGIPWEDRDEIQEAQFKGYAEAVLTAAIVPGDLCRRECMFNLAQRTGHNYGLVRMED